MNIKVIGIDLAKLTFQVCALKNNGKLLFNKKVSRKNLLSTIRQLDTDAFIAMESCSTCHYWGRLFEEMGSIQFVWYLHSMLSHLLKYKRMMLMMHWQFVKQHYARIYTLFKSNQLVSKIFVHYTKLDKVLFNSVQLRQISYELKLENMELFLTSLLVNC